MGGTFDNDLINITVLRCQVKVKVGTFNSVTLNLCVTFSC